MTMKIETTKEVVIKDEDDNTIVRVVSYNNTPEVQVYLNNIPETMDIDHAISLFESINEELKNIKFD